MSIRELTDPDAVLEAIKEYDQIGQDAFLERYGFGSARAFWLVHDGKRYDSKAIVGAAFGYQYPDRGPLTSAEFSGGTQTVLPILRSLGFDVEVDLTPEQISRAFRTLSTATLSDGRRAPHKPLLSLLTLRRVKEGHQRLISVQTMAAELKEILGLALPGVESPSPWEPIWRLEDTVWEVTDGEGRWRAGERVGDPQVADLNRPGVLCGLSEPVHVVLADSTEWIDRIQKEIIDQYLDGIPEAAVTRALGGSQVPRRVWWVNQGRTYRQERDGSYIWAPTLAKNGRPLAHHVAVSQVRPGDVVLHYADGAIQALGRVTSVAIVVPRPAELPSDLWDAEGYKADVQYCELERPIELQEMLDRPTSVGPFNSSAGINQGYLYAVPPDWTDRLRREFQGRWPSASPWAANHHWLFQANPEKWSLRTRLETWSVGELEPWSLMRYADDIQDGDDVLLFSSGSDGGIMALGTIDGEPRLGPRPDWRSEGPPEQQYVDVRLVRRLDTPITRSDLRAHPVLSELAVLKFSQATNYKVTDEEWNAVIDLLVDADVSSSADDLTLEDVVTQFAADLRLTGYDYGESRHIELVRTFITSLATKRFVILTGLSGSGKTKIAQQFGHWLGEDRVSLVAVRPDWTSPDALLGYENGLSQCLDNGYAWNAPDVLRFILKAAAHPSEPFVLILDEMNLAHVERYFADVLSGMESNDAVIPNLAEEDFEWRLSVGEPTKVPFPANLFTVGTVNVDETTYMFSPKVLDRANTIEFRVATGDLSVADFAPTAIVPAAPALRSAFLRAATEPAVPTESGALVASSMKELHLRLVAHGREFGHRTFAETIRFADLLATAGDDDSAAALDLQVLQKVLPKFHGSIRELSEALNDLGAWCFYGPGETGPVQFDAAGEQTVPAALPRSFDKIHRMAKRLRTNHFVSFAE